MVSARPPPRPPSGWMGICAPPRHASAARTTAARWRLLLTHCSAAGAPHQELPAEGPSPQTVGWDPEAGAKAVDARCPTSQIRLAAGWRVAGGGRRAGHQFRWVGQCPCRWGACASGHSQLEPLLLFGAACGGWASRMLSKRIRCPADGCPCWRSRSHEVQLSTHAARLPVASQPPSAFGVVAPSYFPTAHKAVHMPAVPCQQFKLPPVALLQFSWRLDDASSLL